MSWFLQLPQLVQTKHNGVMKLSRLLGVWTLWGHDGTYQAAPYMDGVWKKAIRRLRKRGCKPQRALLLGVAMGATFGLLQKAWPNVELVGIDWEPALYELGKKIGIARTDSRVRFIEGDAAAVVPTLSQDFDLVIVDLFNGKKVADAVTDAAFQSTVVAKLAPGGVVAINCYNQRAVLDGWRAQLGEPEFVRYQANDVGIFTKTSQK